MSLPTTYNRPLSVMDNWDHVSEKVRKVFEDFHLTAWYPGKIDVQTARRQGRNDAKENSHIPWNFLDNVLSLRYKGRGEFFQVNNEQTVSDSMMENIDEFNWDEDKSAIDVMYSFHDVRVAVFMCCDNICKKILAQKLHMCHLSIPLLLPDIFNQDRFFMQMWALRGLTEDIGIEAKVPIVSFLSVKGSAIIKTKILNWLCSDESFDTFFDRELEESRMNGANIPRVFSNGVIDAACFHPSACACPKRSTEESVKACDCTFKKLLMFLNLYGEVEESQTQKNLMCKISTLVVVVVDAGQVTESVIDNILNIIKESKKSLVVFTKDQKSALQDCKNGVLQVQQVLKGLKDIKVLILFDRKNGSVFLPERTRRAMKQTINEIMDTLDENTSLKDLFQQQFPNITADQDDKDCAKARLCAQNIRDKMQKYSSKGIKEKVLPLQSTDLWGRWSDIERIIRRERPDDNESYDEFIAKRNKEQHVIREKQAAKFNEPSNDIMQDFCKSITLLKGKTRQYFVEWLTLYLNDLSKTHMNPLRKQLVKVREAKLNEIASNDVFKNATSDRGERKTSVLESEAKNLEDQIRNESFGIKHVFREVGQIYEAFRKLKDSENVTLKDFNEEQLAMTVAELFLDGESLEILDCKAKQMPMKFVKSVFNYLKGMLSGKIFVLSAIGIQSSGKSTLLNAMFGTQFSTSVGLCTEGVNAQLIPMPENTRNTEYKYILLIDTKGLRSTDHNDVLVYDAYARDNELATLLFGVSDLTLINMKGESKSEIDNILQIVVHALLDIKQAKKEMQLKSRCLFIHHNVDATDAKEKLKADNTKFKEQLDSVAVSVADQFGLKDVKIFSDIIKFDVDDIKYFPNLWRGLPPMASINEGYSSKVGEVKDIILNNIILNNELPKVDVEKFCTKLCDLWDPIQTEDFVFCFRNHMEINAHNNLESFINDIRWEMNKTKLTTLREMKKRNDADEAKMVNEMTIQLNKAHMVAQAMIDKFFSDSDDGKLLRDWKTHHLKTLEKIKEDKIESSKKVIRAEIKIEKAKSETEVELNKWKQAARQRAIGYAQMNLDQGVGEKMKQEDLEKMFLDLWNTLRKSVSPPTVTDCLESVVRNGFRDMGGLHVTHAQAISFDNEIVGEFILKDSHLTQLEEKTKNDIKSQIYREVTSRIVNEVEAYMVDIREDIVSRTHVEQTVKIVLNTIKMWNTSHSDICLTQQYNTDILMFVAQLSMPYLRKMQESYKDKIDIRQELDAFKEEVRTRFMDTIQKIDKERTEATIFSNELMRLIQMRVDKELVNFIPGDIKYRNFVLNSKKEFMKKIMKDLLAEDIFENYMDYLKHTSDYFERSVRKYVNEYLFDQKMYSQHAIKKSHIITDKVLEVLREDISPMTGKSNATTYSGFLHNLSNIIPEIKDSTKYITDTFVNTNVKADMFYSYLISNVEKIKGMLQETYTNMNKLDSAVEDPICEQLLEHVRGCQKKCPFCQILCINSIEGHSAECKNPQHCPIGMQGYKKQNKFVADTCNAMVLSTDKFRYEGGDLKVPVGKKVRNLFVHLDPHHNHDVVKWRDYKSVYKDWDIEPNNAFDCSLYWKRMLAKFKKELADRYRVQEAAIPQEWHEIKKEEAISSLDQDR